MPSDRSQLRDIMIANAAEINRLHARIHETLKRRNNGEPLRLEWLQACEEFHRRYDEFLVGT